MKIKLRQEPQNALASLVVGGQGGKGGSDPEIWGERSMMLSQLVLFQPAQENSNYQVY